MSDFEVVALDVYGTLFDITGEDWAAPEVVATMRTTQLQYSWLVSLMGDYRPFSELTRAAVEHALVVHAADADVDRVMEGMLRIRPYPETVAVLDRLRARARLAVLSNGDPPSLEALLANTGVRDRFDWVISAAEVRVFKPAPAVYQRLLDRTSVPRDRVLFVSSNGFDVAGAARFGLRVAWVNRRGSPPEGVGGEAEFIVKDLAELAGRVAQA